MIIGRGVAAEAVEIAPKNGGAFSASRFLRGGLARFINFVGITGVYVDDEVFADDAEIERQEFLGGSGNSKLVVFDHENNGQLLLHGKCDGFIEFALARGSIAHAGET